MFNKENYQSEPTTKQGKRTEENFAGNLAQMNEALAQKIKNKQLREELYGLRRQNIASNQNMEEGLEALCCGIEAYHIDFEDKICSKELKLLKIENLVKKLKNEYLKKMKQKNERILEVEKKAEWLSAENEELRKMLTMQQIDHNRRPQAKNENLSSFDSFNITPQKQGKE
jgi:hypothetical protein